MKSVVLLFAFVLLQAESDAKPIWITGVTPTVATSPRLSQRPPSAQRIADKIFKNQRLTEFVEATLRNLFDKNDIIPEEHDWGGPDRPFDIDEYFSISPPEKPKKSGWKKFWEGIQALFSPSNEIRGAAGAAGVRTTFGTDGTAKGDTESLFDFTENDTGSWKTAPERIDGAGTSDSENRYTMHGARGSK